MFASQGKGDTALCGVDDGWVGVDRRQGAQDRRRCAPGLGRRGAGRRHQRLRRHLARPASRADQGRDRSARHAGAEGPAQLAECLHGLWRGAGAWASIPTRSPRPWRAFPAWRIACSRWRVAGDIAFINDFKGHQCRCGREGAVVLRYDLLDRRRHRQGRRHRAVAPLFSQCRPQLSDWSGGGAIRRDAGQRHAGREMRHAGEGGCRGACAMPRRMAATGAVVLLSPACASFDQYPNFEVRGDAFVKAVAALPGIQMTIGGDAHAART